LGCSRTRFRDLKLFCKIGSGSVWTDSRFNRRPTTHRRPLAYIKTNGKCNIQENK